MTPGPPPARKLRDVDAADRALKFKAAFYSGAGAAIGGMVGSFRWGPIGFLIGAPLGYGAVYGFTRLLSAMSGTAASTIYAPSGTSTPARKEYSHAQSLALRGRYDEAILAYQKFCIETPDDPEPYIRIARIYRDELKRFDDAIEWFKRVRTDAKLPLGQEQVVTQELVEIYTHRLATPQRAIPELARLADRFPGTEAAAWARQRIAELRTTAAGPQ